MRILMLLRLSSPTVFTAFFRPPGRRRARLWLVRIPEQRPLENGKMEKIRAILEHHTHDDKNNDRPP